MAPVSCRQGCAFAFVSLLRGGECESERGREKERELQRERASERESLREREKTLIRNNVHNGGNLIHV
jgi:hypothetical protein